MTTLYLIRHGETEWNRLRKLQGQQDLPLNSAGLAQATELAAIFARLDIQAVTSSTLGRARQTAQAIAAASNIAEVAEYKGLIERDFGSASGMTYEEKAAAYPDNFVPDAESNEHLYARVIASLRDIADKNAGKTTVVVSHGGAINAVLNYLTDGVQGTGKTVLKNGSVTKLFFESGEFRIAYVNAEPGKVLEMEAGSLGVV